MIKLLMLFLTKKFSSVQLLSHVHLFATPWTAVCQASLSITNSRSLPKLTSIESVMPSNHLILCHPLLLQPSILPSIRVFSNELVLHIRWPKYWSFSFSIKPSSEYSGLISFRMDWLDLLAVQETLKSLQHHSSRADKKAIKRRRTRNPKAQQSGAFGPICLDAQYIQPKRSQFRFSKAKKCQCSGNVPYKTIHFLIIFHSQSMHFPGGSMVKNPSANAADIRDVGSIPGSRRSPRGGHGNPLQYSCLGNPMDRGAWWATVHKAAKSRTQLKWLYMLAWPEYNYILNEVLAIPLKEICSQNTTLQDEHTSQYAYCSTVHNIEKLKTKYLLKLTIWSILNTV